jgi:non-homologous end joining protein Ku
LKALVRRKASGKPVIAVEREQKPDNVINLMDALKQSLKGKRAAKRRTTSPASRRAPQRRATRKAHRSAARARKAGSLRSAGS